MPLVQGGTISFLVPTLAILSLPQWKCPSNEIMNEMSHENRTELWQIRMRELSGAIAISSLFQVFIGLFGIIGYLLKFITPLTIVPTVSLVGLSLFDNASDAASKHWGISIATIIMLTVYSQILTNIRFPILIYTKNQGIKVNWFYLFKLFPVSLTQFISIFFFIILFHFLFYFIYTFIPGIVDNNCHVVCMWIFNSIKLFTNRSSSKNRC